MKYRLQQLAAAILLLLPLYYLRFNIFGLPTNLVEVLVAILFVLTLMRRPSLLASFRKNGLKWPIALILAGLFLGCLVSLDKYAALGILKGWFVVPILYYSCVLDLFSEDGYGLIISALFINIIIVALYALLQCAGIIHLLSYQSASEGIRAYLTQHRAIAFFESPNYLAMYLVPTILMVFGYQYSRKEFGKLLLLTTPFLAVVLTASRGGLVALVVGFVVIVSAKKGFRWATISGIIALVVSAGLLLSLPHVGGSGGDQARTYIWSHALALIKEHPILGIGPGQFNGELNAKLANDAYYQDSVREYALHAHNVFLNFYLSGGILALVGFVWACVVIIGQQLKSNRDTVARLSLLAALLAVLIHGMVDTTYFKNDLAIHFWLIAALSVTMKPKETMSTNEKDRD